MKRSESCILTNMCMVYDNDRFLVQERRGPSWPGICFPGGHIEKGESFVESTIREVKEETGLDIWSLQLCGLKQFTRDDCRYIVIYFKTNCFKGMVQSSDEGEVFWVNRNEINQYQLCSGFDEMLKVFLDDTLNENFYTEDEHGWGIRNL